MTALEIMEMVGVGEATRRSPQGDGFTVPADAVVVSADSHWLEEPDLWVERFPAHLKHRAPRMFNNGAGWEMEVDGKTFIGSAQAAGFATFEAVAGMNQVAARVVDLDAEGVDHEILFPQRTLALIRVPDLEYREWCFRAYNQYLGDICRREPRLHGVGILKWWDPEATADALAELQDLGFKTVMAPIEPGKFDDGEPINYQDPRMDPFWAAVEASGLPLCFHIGENTKTGGQGIVGMFVLEQMQGFRNLWGRLTFGGVFDRFPNLRVVFVEGQLNWVPGALQDADMIYNGFPSMIAPKLEHSPSHYWRRNCYATFMVDPAGLEMIHRIGADRALWSSDYPHNESTLGYTRSAVAAVFSSATAQDARRMVGGNAVELFRLDI